MARHQMAEQSNGGNYPDLFDARTNAPHTPNEPHDARSFERPIPFRERPTCTIKEACRAVGLGRTKLYELINGGSLKTTTIGRRRLVLVPSLLKHLHIDEI